MTLRVSFPKLIIETLRRHLAAVLITVLAFFLHIVTFFLNVQNILSQEYVQDIASSSFLPVSPNSSKYVIEALSSLCSPNVLNMVMAILLGIYLAFEFFRYMHSRKESDFYDSMPIRKEKWFLNLFVTSVGLFVILVSIAYAIEFAIVSGVGFSSKQLFLCMLWNLICTIGAFLVCWVTTVLTMVMTGHSIIAFLGFGIFASYIPLIVGYLFPVYANTFFKTYVNKGISSIYNYFSPISLAYKVTHNYNYWNIDEHWTYLIGCYIFAIIIGLVAYVLFLRRPSETAGRAMAFEKVNSWIRVLLVIPLALYAGLLLNEITSVASTAWLVFGVIFAACLLHGVIEAIFQFDIKALVSKRRQLLFTVLFCLAFVFVFWADVFQYDNYVPDEKNIKTVKIDTYLFDDNGKYFDDLTDGLSGEYVDDALTVIKDIREHMEASDSENYIYANDFTVTYELKNGSTRQRRYPYYGNEFPKSLDALSTTEEFKNDFCVLYHLDSVDVSSVSVFNGMESFPLNLTKEQLKEFSKIYLDEYTKLTLTESLSKEALYKLMISYPNPREDRDYDVTSEYKIYAHFDNTLAFLKKYNVVSFHESSDIKLENMEIHSDKFQKEGQQYISDEQQLNELKKYMLLGEFLYHNYEREEEYIYCNLRCVSNGNTRYLDVYIKPSDFSKVLGN